MMKQKQSSIVWLSLFMLLMCISCQSYANNTCWYRKAGIVEITRKGDKVGAFSVALADTPRQQQQGLMHCQALAPESGMLFIYPDAGKRVFWMKNTWIDLAIIFISADGEIASIAHGQPGSLQRIHSPENIQSVLEINFAESRDLAVGDRVKWHIDK